MRINTNYWAWPNVLSIEACQHLIKTYYVEEKAIDAKVNGLHGDSVQPETRITNVCWIHEEDPISVTIMNFALRANNKAGWNFDVDSIGPVQMGQYLPGGHYSWHTDTTVTDVDALNTQRKLSVVVMLSNPDDYEGGGLEFDRFNTTSVSKGQGSVYVFPSILEHRVLPVTSGVRYSLTGWCRGPAFR